MRIKNVLLIFSIIILSTSVFLFAFMSQQLILGRSVLADTDNSMYFNYHNSMIIGGSLACFFICLLFSSYVLDFFKWIKIRRTKRWIKKLVAQLEERKNILNMKVELSKQSQSKFSNQ